MSPNSSADIPETALCAEIHRRIGSNLPSQLLNTLISVPGCLGSFWSSVEPAFHACLIRSAAEVLRKEADLEIRDTLEFSNHLRCLRESGRSREDARQIRYVMEAFHHLEPIFAVLAQLTLRWLGGETEGSLELLDGCDLRTTPAVFIGEIELAGDPGSHPIFRALGAWPEYLEKVTDERQSKVETDIARRLSVLLGILTCRIPLAGSGLDYSSRELRVSVEACLDRSLNAIALAAALRRGFVKSEIAERNRRIRSAGVCSVLCANSAKMGTVPSHRRVDCPHFRGRA